MENSTGVTGSGYQRLLFPLLFLVLILPTAIAASKKAPKGTMVGPTGISGIFQPGWPKTPTEIKVTHIEEGSPASGTDLKVGDVVVAFGEEKFSRHPLWHLADAVEAAEANGGSFSLLLNTGRKVELKLAALGPYSKTAPYNCPKTDSIIKKAADHLVANGGGGVTRTDLLGLMATGEKAHLDVVSQRIHEGGILKIDRKEVEAYLAGAPNQWGHNTWGWGYSLIALGEYYLLTQDEKVLPAIHTYALALSKGQDVLGLWGHSMSRGPLRRAPGYGTMNQPSISCLLGLILAQRCGIKDPIVDKALEKTYATIADVAGKGGFSYGKGGAWDVHFNNNGTSGSAAICLSLKGDQEGAAFFSKGAATAYDSLTSGHASSFFNPLWTPLGASLSGPEVTQQFFKKTLWYFTGERHWKGGFPKSDKAGAVAGQALLSYCIPRKVLLITGREADPSLYVKGQEARDVIMRSKIDYDRKSNLELLALLKDPLIQVRLKAKDKLARRCGDDKKVKEILPKIYEMIKRGSEQDKLMGLALFRKCHEKVSVRNKDFLIAVFTDESEALKVRIAAASALSGKALAKDAMPYYNDILKLVFEVPQEDGFFRHQENQISKVLSEISKNTGKKALDEDFKVNRDLLYKVANRFLEHPRQNVRAVGSALLLGLPKEDFHKIAGNLLHALKGKDPGYHSYSNAVNVPGIQLLAENNIKEGLDLLVDAVFHGGGKWAFRYRSLMKTLPHYGGNAEPYIEKFEAHKDINKKGDRFTPAWQKVVKQIREDKSPPKLISVEEAVAIGTQD